MNKIILFANQLDRAGLLAEADKLDKLLLAYERIDEQAQLDAADKQAIEIMKKAIESGKLDHLSEEQMRDWIRQKESSLH